MTPLPSPAATCSICTLTDKAICKLCPFNQGAKTPEENKQIAKELNK